MDNKNHILVVDDDDRIRNLLKEYLHEKKFIVTTAQNSGEAKIKLGHFKFDLIVLDVMMPGQSGYELTKEIKSNDCPPIILLTAKGEVENRIKGLELGADDYLGKPFEPKELLLRIKNIISKKNKIDPNKEYLVGEAIIDLSKMVIKLKNIPKKINVTEKKNFIRNVIKPWQNLFKIKNWRIVRNITRKID